LSLGQSEPFFYEVCVEYTRRDNYKVTVKGIRNRVSKRLSNVPGIYMRDFYSKR